MKRLLLIVNPASGTGKIKTQLFHVVNILSQQYEVTVYITRKRGDATVYAETLDSSFDTIVVCGGDGTLNEVVTGLIKNKNSYRLGYIPSGTLNEWSSGLKISRDMKKAALDVLFNNTIPLDLGKFNDNYFTYTASFGAFTEASYSAPQDIKNLLGKLAYFFEGIKTLESIRPIPLKITCGDRVIEDNFVFGTISNSLSVGGVVHYNETVVELSDGEFEVLLLHYPKTLNDLNNLITGILTRDLNRDGITFLQTNKVFIENAGNVEWTLDGEYVAPQDKIVIENLHKAATFIVPPKK
ncbi:MAG: diacylglycerol kinase family lipid kinase [Ruminococcaceae bacterium]|nr:diacylglycerol kinase family lipid kinase [Oscillospiraceae bacterium]